MRIAPALAIVLIVLIVVFAGPAHGRQPIIYPAQGQGSQWQTGDMGQCEAWARQTTGVNPATWQEQQYVAQDTSQQIATCNRAVCYEECKEMASRNGLRFHDASRSIITMRFPEYGVHMLLQAAQRMRAHVVEPEHSRRTSARSSHSLSRIERRKSISAQKRLDVVVGGVVFDIGSQKLRYADVLRVDSPLISFHCRRQAGAYCNPRRSCRRVEFALVRE
jgi:hypothetical protein